MMVGSELPQPGDAASRRSPTRSVLAVWTASRVAQPDGRPRARRRRPDDPRRRGRRHRRRRGQRPDRAGRGDHGHRSRPPAARSRSAGEDITRAGRPRSAGARRASATSRRTGTARGCCWTRRCGRTGSSATRPAADAPTGVLLDRRRRHARTPSGSSTSSTSARPGIDVPAAALSGGNQQKLIVGRELSGDPSAADRRAPDPRCRRRRAGRRSGTSSRDARAAGLAVLLDLGRPRRADRPVRHASGDAARPGWSATLDPTHGHPRGARRGMTGAGDERRDEELVADAVGEQGDRTDRILRGAAAAAQRR